MPSNICENCAYYDYDEEYECYECGVNLDEVCYNVKAVTDNVPLPRLATV